MILSGRSSQSGAARLKYEVLAVLDAPNILDDWGRIGFFLQTHGSLGDRCPLDLLRENRLDLVVKAAAFYVE